MATLQSLVRLGRAAARQPVTRKIVGRPFAPVALRSTPCFFSTEKGSEPPPPASEKAAAKAEPEKAAAPPGESREFQAETRQLLDIVTNSLYTDKEVFLRELVSNASDSLEKLRHIQTSGTHPVIDSEVPLEILITANQEDFTLTIADTGIGMSKDELIDNLGTIARSGSKAFLQQASTRETPGEDSFDASKGIIGKFGVGFYSAFMVGEKVDVISKSAYESNAEELPKVWSSSGSGSYEIADAVESQQRGSAIVIKLKEEHIEFCDKDRIEGILKKYSNFVNFPIKLNGELVNTMEAIWANQPSDVDKETYTAFYRFIANAFDEPLDQLHFRADAPIDVKALFYIPSFHSEKYGMGRMEPGVALYSRKVLIESKCPDIVPDWMRFVKGVVDSEDLPLSVSREKAQDSMLIAKLKKVLTRKFISHLAKMARKEPEKYKDEFYHEYGHFLKEGICQDFEFQQSLAKILYFETSKGMRLDLSSLDEYIARCTPEQKDIYYLFTPSRDLAVQSPYMEGFEKSGQEVLFVYTPIDDFVMSTLEKYEGRNLVSIEKANIDLPKDEKDGDKDDSTNTDGLSEADAAELCKWLQLTLPTKVGTCKPTTRLASSPAVITDTESGAMRRMMRMVETNTKEGGMPLPKQLVEINPSHPIMIGLNTIREVEPDLAKVLAEQIFDNCLVAAGLMDDGRAMLPRLNDLLSTIVTDTANGIDPDKLAAAKAAAAKVEAEVVEAEAVDGKIFDDTKPGVVEGELVDEVKPESGADSSDKK